MTLFTLLFVLVWERLFKPGEHWQLETRLEAVFRRRRHYSLSSTLLMMAVMMLVTLIIILILKGLFFGLLQLIFWIGVGLLCTGAGVARQHYRAYLNAAGRQDASAKQAMAQELMLIHGVVQNCNEREYLHELQNALLWINYRYYLAPLFWFVVGGAYGPVLLTGYAFLRAWQTWLARHCSSLERSQTGVDFLLHYIDWIPVRLVGIAYALVGHGELALPAWFASLSDFHRSQYEVLTSFAQFALMRDPQTDDIKTPRAAVSLAKRVALVLVVVVALLTIYGALI